MANDKKCDVCSEDERQQLMDELIELIDLQIKLKEGGLWFKIAHFFGFPGTRVEHIQEKLKKRLIVRRSLQKEETEDLQKDVELSKLKLQGLEANVDENQKEYNTRMLKVEEIMEDLKKAKYNK